MAQSFSKRVRDYKGIKGHDVLGLLSRTALWVCLFNQNSFRFKGLIETVNFYHYDLFVRVIISFKIEWIMLVIASEIQSV